MNVLVLGGTLFFGVQMIEELLEKGHTVTIATRGLREDGFGNRVKRIILDRHDDEILKKQLLGKQFDVIIDKIAYSANDVKRLLDVVKCKKYIVMSSMMVYHDFHVEMKEEEFDPNSMTVQWIERSEMSYDDGKRYLECSLSTQYKNQQTICVRYPFVVGIDDYTKRLHFYVEHILNHKPMYVDNLNERMSFINSNEAGGFLAFLVSSSFTGAINGASEGEVSISEIIQYVEDKTGEKAILKESGDVAPYNTTMEYSLDCKKAEMLGYHFSQIKDWMYDLIDLIIYDFYSRN